MKFKSDIELQAGLRDGSNDIGTSGQILSSTGSQTNWIDQSSIVASEAKLVVIECKNTSGSAISKGTPVYQTGTVGATDVIEIDAADASDEDKMAAIGLLQTDLANNAFGKVVITGELLNITTSPIDGVTPVTGDTIYVKSGGGLTLTKPTGVNFIQNIGLVGKVSGGNSGSITVSSIMRSNDVPTPLYIDHTNQRLGIGVTPSQPLDVNGTALIRNTVYVGDNIQHWGDGGTGLYFGTDTLSLQNNGGNTRLYIQSGGNVGIGTTSPGAKLHVRSTASNYVATFKHSTGTGYAPGSILLEAGQGNARGQGIYHYNNVADENWFTGVPYNVDSKKWIVANKYSTTQDVDTAQLNYALLTIDSDTGNVGIGTTSPSTKLQVDSSTAFSLTNGSGDTLLLTNDSTVSAIGAIGPSIGFGNMNNNNRTSAIAAVRTGGDHDNMGLAFFTHPSDSGDETVVQKMTITHEGNVGIGTTSPGAKLDVNGVIRSRGGSYAADVDTKTDVGLVIPENYFIYTADGSSYLRKLIGKTSDIITIGEAGTSLIDGINLVPGTAGGYVQIFNNSSIAAKFVDGKLGIGTTSPRTKLHITGLSGDDDPTLGSSTAPFFVSNTANSYGLNIGVDVNGTSWLQSQSNTSATAYKMSLNPLGGNVGIGTTSPARNFHVHASSLTDIHITNDDTGSTLTDGGTITMAALDLLVNNREAGNLQLRTSGTERMRITSTGNVGIGTTSPDADFVVSHQGTSGIEIEANFQTGVNNILSFDRTVGALAYETMRLSANDYWFTTLGIERMRINSSGNVGIGTTSPGQKLDVNGNANIDGTLFVNTTNNHIRLVDTDNTGNFSVGVNTNFQIRDITANTTPLTIRAGTPGNTILTTSSGRVGIGLSSPGVTLHVNGFARLNGGLQMNATNATIYQILDSDLRFGTNNTERMRIDNAGNVGIGTTSPSDLLHIKSTTTDARMIIDGADGFDAELKFFEDGNVKYTTGFDAATDSYVIGTVNVDTNKRLVINNSGALQLPTYTAGTLVSDASGNITVSSGGGAGGPYLPLSAGSGEILTGDLAMNNNIGIITKDSSGAFRDILKLNSSNVLEIGSSSLATNTIFKNSGNVGIGTTSPSTKLNISSASYNDHITLTRSTDELGISVSGGQLMFEGGVSPFNNNDKDLGRSDKYWRELFVYSVRSGGALQFKTNGNNERMRIDSTGNVGIGTTTPTAPLHIEGGTNSEVLKIEADANPYIRWVQNGTDVGFLQFNGGSAYLSNMANGSFFFRTNNTDKMTILSSGNVGIGITSPSSKLQVYSSTVGQYMEVGAGDGGGRSLVFTSSDNNGSAGALHTINAKSISGAIALSTSGNERMRITNTGNVGIGNTAPVNGKLVVTSGIDGPLNTVRIQHTRDDADAGTKALEIDMNLSGADTTTGDRTNRGIYVDLDSSADGDAAHEHRIHGIESDVRFTGFSDIVRAGQFYAESNNITEKTAQLVGVFGQAIHDANSTDGGVSNMMGVYGYSQPQDLGDVDNAFGGYFLVNIGTNRGNADIGVTKGVEGKISIDKSSTINYGTMIGVSSIIDNNEGAVPNFGNQYLFKGDYQGTKGSNAYGIYTEGDKHYFDGKVGIGNTSPDEKLEVSGSGASDYPYIKISNPSQTGRYMRIGMIDSINHCIEANGGSTYLTFKTNATERMRIATDGAIQFNDYGAGTLVTDSSGNITVSSGGGAGGPYLPLSAGSGYPLTGALYLENSNTDVVMSGNTSGNFTIDNNTGNIAFLANGSSVQSMTITSSLITINEPTNFTNGNVGIGTTNPDSMLHVARNGNSNGGTILMGPKGNATSKWSYLAGTHYNQDTGSTNGTGSAGVAIIGSLSTETYNKVFIGGNPYEINAATQIEFWTHSSTLSTQGGTQRGYINSGGDWFLADTLWVDNADGNVGIGTTSPDAKLEVNGNVAINSTGLTEGFQWFNDTNEIFSLEDTSGAGELLLLSSNSVKVKLNANGNSYFNGGNVGIGTTSPTRKLHVVGGSTYAALLDSNQDYTLGLARSGTEEWWLKTYTDGRFAIHENGVGDKVTIKAGGNVGIGTTSPGKKLDVAGDWRFDGITGGHFENYTYGSQLDISELTSGGWARANRIATSDSDAYVFSGVLGDDTTLTRAYWTIGSSSDATGYTYSNGIILLKNGNVGIGTTSPRGKLDIVGNTDDDADFLTIQDNDPSAGSHRPSIRFRSDTAQIGQIVSLDNSMRFSVGTTEDSLLEITSAGNVGIGTTSPSDKLHVNGTIRSQAPATSDWGFIGYNSAGSASSGLWFSSGSGELLLRRSDNSLQTKIVSAGSSYINGGNLGLGTTSPAQKLTVNSGRMLVSNTTTPIYIKAGSTYKSWVHHIGGSDGYIFAPSTADNGETWDWANQTKLGANGVVTAKNFQLSSDERFKNNIKDIKDIKVEAAFKSFEMESSPGEKRYGVVAQELEKTNPELVETDHEGFKSVKYIDLLIAKIAELEARLEKLEK